MSKIGVQTRGSGAVMRQYLRGGGVAKRGKGAALKTGGRAALWNGGPPNTGRTNLLEQLGRVEAERSNPNRRAEISRVHGELNRGYAKGGRAGLKHGGKPWGTGPKPGTHEYLMQHLHKPRKGKAAGSIVKAVPKITKRFLDFIKTGKDVDKAGVKVNVAKAAERLTGKPHVDHGIRKRIKHLGRGKAEGGRIGKALGGGLDPKQHKPKPRSPKRALDWKPRTWPQQKPPQLRKSIKERREELRKKARKSGGHSKIVFADEWEKIDPGLQKGLFKKEGGRIGLKEGGNGKWIQKATKGMVKTKPCTGKKFGSKSCPPGSRRYNLAKTFKKMGRERKAEG
jgi:hypothetical protein